MLTDEVREFIRENKINNCTIIPDGTIDVNWSVEIKLKCSKLPIKFGKVTGYFYCNDVELVSLEGVPSHVGSYFSCENNLLTSLHDVHKYFKEINGCFYCRENPIKDSVLGLLLIKGIIYIALDNIQVQDILNKYLSKGRVGVIGAQQELLDAGLDEYARL